MVKFSDKRAISICQWYCLSTTCSACFTNLFRFLTHIVTNPLAKLCERCDRKGKLQGSIKLGDAKIGREELRRLQGIFGKSLRISQKGEVRLNLNLFLDNIPNRNAWITELYQTVGRQPQNLLAQAKDETKMLRQLLEQLRLAFPELDAVHCELRKRGESVTLSLDNLANIERAKFDEGDIIVTC